MRASFMDNPYFHEVILQYSCKEPMVRQATIKTTTGKKKVERNVSIGKKSRR